MIPRPASAALCFLLLVACGGDDEAPAPGTPAAVQPSANGAAAAGTPDAGGAPGAAPASANDSTRLLREVFSYRGQARDPFMSLLKSASIRPLVQDVRVTGIAFDPTYPARSVAMLRDSSQKKQYSVRVGDELGLMRVSEIRTDAVVVTLDEFGAERQVVLQLRRTKEKT